MQEKITQDDLGVEVVHEAAHELGLDRDLVGQHSEVVSKVCVLRDDDAQPCSFELGPPSPPENLLHVQHACSRQGVGF